MYNKEKISPSVSRETEKKLELYESLLKRWQKSINLISNNTIDDIWERHFIDSIQLSDIMVGTNYICGDYSEKDKKEYNKGGVISKNDKIVDIGSGAGFPGMVLSILGFDNISLVESDRKKCLFLSEVARNLSLDVEIINSRVEDVIFQDVKVFISRACASLDKLLYLVEKNITNNTICYFHKGKEYDREIEDMKRYWKCQIVTHQSATDSQAAVIELKNIVKREKV